MAIENLSGRVIKGYELQELIGAGGFGAVYRAYQTLIKREVAVKVVLPEYANHPEFIRRFEAEAQLVARLEHIHIVSLYDYWRDHTGAYLVMRWLRGGSLRNALENGHWPLHDSARLIDQIASALAVAHRNGVIHRDLKPDNILLDEDRNAYLADFGIAKDLEKITDYAALIEADEEEAFFGSPSYIAPEQIRTEPVSPQTDIYSMGILIYEILTGKTPFHGLPVSTLIFKHLQDPLPHLNEVRPDLPEELNLVIAKATEKEPGDRYPSILALAVDFKRALLASEGLSPGLEGDSLDTVDLSHLGITEEIMVSDLSRLVIENPYKGLRAFQEADADDFYGREALIEALVDRLRANDVPARFLAVVGPSGSGKSSAVKAGLLPKLRRGSIPGSSNWFIVEMVPGAHPMEELEAALLRVAVNPPASLLQQLNEDARGFIRAVKRVLPGSGTAIDSELVLVIDQFEEVFTQVEKEAERTHFLKSLLAAAYEPESRIRVILTLRADFYDRPLLYPGFGELVRACTEIVLPLNTEELEKAIVEPAERAGLALEAGLVTSIIADVGEQPGALPLLQYALTELFERRDGRWLTINAYKAINGVSGALARRAGELYEDMDSDAQQVAQQIFLRLVTLGEGAEDTRRRVLLSELLSLQSNEAGVQGVIDLFGKYRLLTFDRDPITRSPTVEIAHEALIRQWDLLRQWLADSREDLRMQRRVAAATEEWRNAAKDNSFLASGTRLDQFESWMRDTKVMLTGDEQEYLRASLAQRERRRAEEEVRKAKEAALERRSRNFLRALVGVLAVATIGALVLTLVAFNQNTIAQQNAATATHAQGEAILQAENAATAAAIADANAAEARNLAFVSGAQLALAENNTDLAILLALEAQAVGEPNVPTMRMLAEAGYAPGTRRIFTGHSDRVMSVDYSPDGQYVVSGARDNSVILWDAQTGEIMQRLGGHDDFVWDAEYSPDGRHVVSASQDKTLILWDAQTGEMIRRFEGHTDAVTSAAFNVDGTQLISGSADKTLILWDTQTGEMIRRFEGSASGILAVDFSKSGFTALSGGEDGSITLWNVQAGQPLLTFGSEAGGHTADVWSVTYTPDELGMVSGSEDSHILLWSFETGQPIRRFEGHSSRVTSVVFSPDGKRIASGSEDNSVILWDTATGAVLQRFLGHIFLVYDVAFSPDSKQLVSASWDGTLREWDLENGAQLQALNANDSAYPGGVLAAAYTPDGKGAVTGSADGKIRLWSASTGALLREFDGQGGAVNAIAVNPDGSRALAGTDDELLRLWDLETGSLLRTYEGHSDAIWAVDFSSDGQYAVTGSRDNTLILWDVESGQSLRRLFGHSFRVTGADFSPDGSQIISSSFDNTLILWDVSTGEMIRRFEGHQDWIRGVTFSPDGKSILSVSADNTLILWDAASGQRVKTFEGHTAQVYSVAFSPDGKYAISGSADRSVIVWDISAGIEIQRFRGHSDAVHSVAFNPDGKAVLSGSGDHTARVWQLRLTAAELVDWIRANRYIRDFTCTERERFGAEPLCATPTPVIIPGQTT